jgi:hypothetical protein
MVTDPIIDFAFRGYICYLCTQYVCVPCMPCGLGLTLPEKAKSNEGKVFRID